ncbi:MAG: hypothetical protein II947_03735 [Bacteroidaceae bacterium]|nr:hypothetical protein [Bacteroidaceae bacterium]
MQEMRRRVAKQLMESSRTIEGEQQDNRWRAAGQSLESAGKRKKIQEKSQKNKKNNA